MATLRDATSGATLATELRFATGVWSRIRGLMFRPSLDPGEALAIRPCSSIHMMFMRFPIDAVFYDRENRVTKVARNVRPWVGLAFGGKGARAVVEMAARAAEGVEPGHLLDFED